MPQSRFGLFPGRSPLLGESLLFSLPTGTKMFQFPAFASVVRQMTGIRPAGLSHSEICGSQDMCSYPQLIAACHVLRRLREPRHPPYALIYTVPPLSLLTLRTRARASCLHCAALASGAFASWFVTMLRKLFSVGCYCGVQYVIDRFLSAWTGGWRITDSNR